MKHVAIAIIISFALSGCATQGGLFGPDSSTATSGGANYSYEHTSPDGFSCKVTANSARDIQGGQVAVSKDCDFTGGVDTTGGVSGAFDVFGKLIDVMRTPVPVPVPSSTGVGNSAIPVSP